MSDAGDAPIDRHVQLTHRSPPEADRPAPRIDIEPGVLLSLIASVHTQAVIREVFNAVDAGDEGATLEDVTQALTDSDTYPEDDAASVEHIRKRHSFTLIHDTLPRLDRHGITTDSDLIRPGEHFNRARTILNAAYLVLHRDDAAVVGRLPDNGPINGGGS